ncbi:MAG TPA: site-specific integrase [Syntrophorhabdales bacterium]|nr:site-specific integrase [Syntrophorhabdales bacterium]
MRGGIAKKGNNYYPYLWINGKKKWFSGAGTSKRAAQNILNEKLAEIQAGTYHELKKIKFKDFAKLWFDLYARSATKPSTLRSYEDIAEKHLKPAFGETYLNQITTVMLQTYVAKRLESVKPKTVINELVLIKEMFRHAVRWAYIKANPAEYVERPRVETEEMAILTLEEVRDLLHDTNYEQLRSIFTDTTYIVVLTAVLTGLRRGELFGLQTEDIDLSTNQIHVRRSLWRGEFITPKSKLSVRNVDMTPRLAAELKEHIFQNPPSDLDLVFCNRKGGPIDPDNFIKRQFIPALERANISKVRFHDLRHTNVAMRIEQGQNIKYIQRQLGHASIQTTLDRYGHLMKNADARQAKRLDELLGFSEQENEGARRLQDEAAPQESKRTLVPVNRVAETRIRRRTTHDLSRPR